MINDVYSTALQKKVYYASPFLLSNNAVFLLKKLLLYSEVLVEYKYCTTAHRGAIMAHAQRDVTVALPIKN